MKKNTKNTLTLHLVSDSTGETLKAVSSAAAAQFSELEYQQKTYPMVRTVTQLERVFKNIKEEKGVVFCTLVEEEVREKLEQFCKKENILYLPVMENIVSVLEEYTGFEAINKPGGQHILNDDYFKRIEAINYTLEHDDGQGQLNLENADVIVVGVSRTSKTPTCIYLANQGIKAANYPLVPHVGISEELENVKNTQVVALITSAHTLVEIRRKRSIELGLNNTDNDYIDIHKVEEEITTAKRIFANKGWPVIDITRRSVEETASAIMNILSLKEEENVERK
ncbi:MAG: kinase/pyrophosphorylase [Rhizobiales bacterium TMED94]|jgi:regulator of PEP synthase PpsR (kinase-PPPase family)|nr:phosphoenolpyruvate synthase regulatory protein [Rhodobiaceae bacterium]RPF85597.1 MAG: kinase/pyrophosphorylase [Rhizobiales bacterium TMED94]|tara:strand:- start:1487 stop:2332 length:846 start_codon:yes stop_codon:yes gene_type:complete